MYRKNKTLSFILKSAVFLIFFLCIATQITVAVEDAESVWVKSMGGTGNDFPRSISIDDSGNVYTVGDFTGTADFDPGIGTTNLTSSGGEDVFISKLDSDGDLVWAKRIGGTTYDSGASVATDSLGNIYTVGSFSGTVDFDPGDGTENMVASGTPNVFISKLDSDGDFVWAKKMGGTTNDYGVSINIDSSDNLFIGGYFSGTSDFDPGVGTSNLTSAGSNDIFISKLDSAGDFVWVKQMGGMTADIVNSIVIDLSGNIYYTGTFSGTADFDPGVGTSNLTSAGNSDAYISKLDSDGDFVWVKQMGSTAFDSGNSIAMDSQDNIYTTGSFSGTVDFDTGDGTEDLVSDGGYDIFVSKLDSDGEFIWASRVGGSGFDSSSSVAIDSQDNIYTTGYFNGTVDFDPGDGTENLVVTTGPDVFISKLDSDGEFVWANSVGGTGSDYGDSIGLDSSAHIYIGGYFSGTADFDPGAGTSNLTSAGSNDTFILKLLNVTLDTTAPVISSIDTNTTETTATITWTTDESATSTLSYGLTTDYGSTSSSDATTTLHSVSLTGLTSGTIYHYQISVSDSEGNIATSTDQTFTTDSMRTIISSGSSGSGGSSGSRGFRRNRTNVVVQDTIQTPTSTTPSVPQANNGKLTIRGLLSLLGITLTPEQEIAVSELEKKQKSNSCVLLTRPMQLGFNDSNTSGEVTKLQRFLIQQGLLSPSTALGYFGNSTEDAVERFQIQNNLVPGGTLETTGFGGVGPVTRERIADGCSN